MTIDLTWAGWFTSIVVLYYAALFVVSLRRPGADTAPPGWESPLMIVVVPARNEEQVIGDTITNLRGLDYAGACRILVVDDASTDTTAALIAEHAAQDPRVRLLSRTAEQGGRGKSDVLNHAYRLIRDAALAGDPWLEGRGPSDIVYAIVDADGRLEKDSLSVVAPYFIDSSVGSTQVGVRIYNAGDSTLARMQDMEFVGFTYLVQIARDRIGSSGLGGNGQFTRLAALMTLGDSPWKMTALTEDLDLGLRLIEAGWRTRFCHHTTVAQQGLTKWRPLLRQRTRWIQGHYQCWSHIPRLARAKGASLAGRFDLVTYLFLVVTVVVISLSMTASVASSLGFVKITSSFLSFVPQGLPLRITSLVLSLLPLATFMLTYQKNSRHPYKWWEVPTFALVFSAYSYVWIVTTARAWTRMLLRRNGWVKTPRVGTVAASAASLELVS
ncbi:glycosyltransferase family 2 protein [uncultured Jatrophihabitans sp.]|uniref:glycosyltransferase family 2 protein n=1 Tax=uncultured Jatrophihabitans sp. TaxID=1610747 RepID=UPI0035CC0C0A